MEERFVIKPPLQHLRVTAREEHFPGLVTLTFKADGKHTLEIAPAQAGQYIALTALIGSSRITRAYTLASSPKETREDGVYIVTVKKAGPLSSYLTEQLHVGDTILSSVPEGDFTYDVKSDEKHIIGVAGGGGITALLSLAKASADGAPFTMTLFYCVENSYEFLFDDVLDSLPKDHVRVVRVAADGIRKDAEKGVFSVELISKHVDGTFSLFACGGDDFYKHVLKTVKGIKTCRRIHLSPNGAVDRILDAREVYSLRVITEAFDVSIPCNNSETIMVAMERAGLSVRSCCHTGRCGWCKSQVIKGDYVVDSQHDTRTEDDEQGGNVCPCSTYPSGNVAIVAPLAL